MAYDLKQNRRSYNTSKDSGKKKIKIMKNSTNFYKEKPKLLINICTIKESNTLEL